MSQNPSLEEMTALVESIVAQVMNKSFGGLATWAENRSRINLDVQYEKNKQEEDKTIQVLGGMAQTANLIDKIKKREQNSSIDFGQRLGGLLGMYDAYKSGDALSGAMSGFAAFGTPLGAAAGLLAGIFSPGIDRWQRPKFKDAKQAFDKLFTVDRGERDEYYLPDSFYFRQRANIPRNIVVKINDKKFDDHVRESLTNNYAAQLQRGLVF